MTPERSILIVAMKFFPASGGSASYAHNLARGFVSLGYRVCVVAPRYTRPFDDSTLPYQVIRTWAASEWFGQFRIFFAAFRIYMVCRRMRPDVLWASTYAGVRALGMMRALRIPTVGTIHSGGVQRAFRSLNPLKQYTDTLGSQFMGSCDALVTVSKGARRLILERNPTVADKLRVIYNGICADESQFITKSVALTHFPAYRDFFVLLTVARLVEAKGHDLVIRALPRILTRYPNTFYVIVGEGIEQDALQKLVADLGVQQKVVFTGYVDDDVRELYYGLADLYVMPGRWTPTFVEGFGLTFIEAAIRGKPAIGSRVGGIPEAIEDSKSGILIDPENLDQLTEAILGLQSDPNRLARMAEYSKKRARAEFSFEIMAAKNHELIETLLSKR